MFTDRERELWETLWRKPIAAIWVRDQQLEQVAMYVRTFAEAETIDCPPPRRTLLRQLAGELLLTIPAMRSAYVRIADVADGGDSEAEEPQKSSRTRLKVVSGAETA